MGNVLLQVAAVAAALIVLAAIVFVVTKRLRLFRPEKATVQFRAIPDPTSLPQTFDKSDSLQGPRLRETSAPAWAARKVELVKSSTTIGRSLESDIVLVGDAVSAQHCRIEREGASFVVVDLGSTNKTWVNGVKVKRAPLNDGDQIRVGATTFVFERPGL